MKLTSSVQSNLSRLPIQGATVLVDALIEAPEEAAQVTELLLEAVGSKGTLVVPTFTQLRTLPECAPEPVAFHRDLAVDPALGALPERFRHHTASIRTDHPANSFAAAGPKTQEVLSTNRDNNPLGPVKKLNVMNALYLRIGQPLHLCSAMHLAEEQSFPNLRYRSTAKRINIAGFEERAVVEHVAICTRGFDTLTDAVTTETASERITADDAIELLPLRVVVHAARAAIGSAPHDILCGRDDCPTWALRVAALESRARALTTE